jgi:hypothetical protein
MWVKRWLIRKAWGARNCKDKFRLGLVLIGPKNKVQVSVGTGYELDLFFLVRRQAGVFMLQWGWSLNNKKKARAKVCELAIRWRSTRNKAQEFVRTSLRLCLVPPCPEASKEGANMVWAIRWRSTRNKAREIVRQVSGFILILLARRQAYRLDREKLIIAGEAKIERSVVVSQRMTRCNV